MNPVCRVTLPAPQFRSGKPYRIQVLQPAFLTGGERITPVTVEGELVTVGFHGVG